MSASVAATLNGFALCASLIMAIGAQNAFVLRQGIAKEYLLLTALTCSLCDLVLMSAGVFGMGKMLQAMPQLQSWMAIAGALFVFTYGIQAFKKAWRPELLQTTGGNSFTSPWRVSAAGIAFRC